MILTQEGSRRVNDYPPTIDYCEVFTDNIDHLYALSLLLTADDAKAEQCFVAGLEDCIEDNPAFGEWARTWATRTIIKNAIRIISPSSTGTTITTDSAPRPAYEVGTLCFAVMKLPPLDRFVYVMSVLERFPDRECSLLLNCTVEDIADARTHAYERLADFARRDRRTRGNSRPHIVLNSLSANTKLSGA